MMCGSMKGNEPLVAETRSTHSASPALTVVLGSIAGLAIYLVRAAAQGALGALARPPASACVRLSSRLDLGGTSPTNPFNLSR
jgi:hypothetical protein